LMRARCVILMPHVAAGHHSTQVGVEVAFVGA